MNATAPPKHGVNPGIGVKMTIQVYTVNARGTVIEDRAGQLSYWALKHPREEPDFHHADGFVLSL